MNDNALQQMLSKNKQAAQNKVWSGEPLIPFRDHPNPFIESAGGTYEEYV